jgi:hypothetical protein
MHKLVRIPAGLLKVQLSNLKQADHLNMVRPTVLLREAELRLVPLQVQAVIQEQEELHLLNKADHRQQIVVLCVDIKDTTGILIGQRPPATHLPVVQKVAHLSDLKK